MAKLKLMRNDGTGNQGGFQALDSSGLSRPMALPRKSYPLVLVAMVLALVVGGICFNGYLNTVVFGAENLQKEVEAQLNRGVTLDLPVMADYVGLSNDKITSKLNSAGYVIVDNSSEEDEKAKGFDYYKIPSDVTPEQAQSALESGLTRADGVTLATYLPGTWRMLMNRSEGVEMKLRYVDFTANSPNVAISNAISSQGFNPKKAGEITQDSAGNFAQSGTLKIGSKTYYWTISTCDLSSVYSAKGLPENAQYVGITIAK